jgi:hypothetical protein
VDCVGQRHGGARGIATGLHHHHKGGGGGNDLAVDAIALLVRLVEQPVGARTVEASLELVTRLVDFLDESASWSAREHCASLLVYVFLFFGKSGAIVVWL